MTHRHADPITIDHIIALRKRVAELERQVENAMSWVTAKKREEERMLGALKRVADNAYDNQMFHLGLNTFKMEEPIP